MIARLQWLLILVVPLIGAGCEAPVVPPPVKLPVPVTVTAVVQRDVPVQVRAIGTVEAFASVALQPQVTARIAKVHFQEGSEVKAGDLLIELDPQPFLAALNQAKASLAKNQAQARFARQQASRYEGLLAQEIVTRDQVDQLRSNAESLAAAVAADRAAIESAQIQLGYCTLRAPISGRTGLLALKEGNLVKANDIALVTLNQIAPVYVTFSVSERMLADVRRGMADGALQVTAAVPNEVGSVETGTIRFLDNAVNATTGTIRLRGQFANESRKLWPGQFVEVVLTLGQRQQALLVPTQAVQTSQQGTFVYVVKADQTVEMRPVTVDFASGQDTLLTQGVAAGETIVVDGQLRLTPGAKVKTGAKAPAADKRP